MIKLFFGKSKELILSWVLKNGSKILFFLLNIINLLVNIWLIKLLFNRFLAVIFGFNDINFIETLLLLLTIQIFKYKKNTPKLIEECIGDVVNVISIRLYYIIICYILIFINFK